MERDIEIEGEGEESEDREKERDKKSERSGASDLDEEMKMATREDKTACAQIF